MKFKILFVFVCLLFSCTQEKKVTPPLTNYIPENAAFIFKINEFSTFKKELTNSNLISELKKTNLYTSLVNKIKALALLNTTSKSLLVFSKQGDFSYEFSFITDASDDLFRIENASNKTIETITSNNKSIKAYKIDASNFYSTIIDEKIIISSSSLVLENYLKNNKNRSTDPTLKKLLTVGNSTKSNSVFINTKNCDSLISSLLKENNLITASFYTDWISLDIKTAENYIYFNGITVAADTTKSYIDLFKNTTPLVNTTPKYAPINTDVLLSYTFDDYRVFSKNQQIYLAREKPLDSIFNTVEEIGLLYIDNKEAVLLNTYGSETIANYLNSHQKNSFYYQGNEITELTNTTFLNDYFNPIIKEFSSNYYTIIENAFIFSADKQNLQTIISNYKNSTTYNTSPFYKIAKEVLANESSILCIANSDGIETVLNKKFSDSISKDYKRINLPNYVFASQIISDQNIHHTNTVIKKIEKEVKNNFISPLHSIQLEDEIVTNPQFVVNHLTKKREIIVQDNANNLYLISTEGKILWKKQLSGRLQGKVTQVDLQKNGKLQLAFTTDSEFLILDRNGKKMPFFNKIYNSGNLNELAVFDYENRKNYRFVVTQGTKIFMYNNKAEIVAGFTYTSSKNPVIEAPKHFRIKNKDYVVFKHENNDLKILSRTGTSRIKVENKIDFSDNSIKLYQNKFTITDKKGVLHQIDEKGEIVTKNLNLNKYHGFDATSKTLVYIDENVLSIKGKKIELDLGLYSKPKIFYLYNKIYVSITDIQNQKIYLFDSNANPISNFPVFGTSVIDLEDIDNDKKLEFVTKDTDDSLIIYKIN